MREMADEFNGDDHETADGRPIRIQIVSCDSAAQAEDLVDRVNGGTGAERGCRSNGAPAIDPTVVTPQSSDWLVKVNADAGRTVVDLDATENIAETWLGIVTYRAMAECLGYPDVALGYEDLIALHDDEAGWSAHDCARLDWGKKPLLAYTNPFTSTSGRNVLVSLYTMAAGKSAADLTVADVERPDVVAAVEDFQRLVAHYMPTTLSLNTKVAQGPGYGHFFLMPEDNLVSLQRGDETWIAPDGTEQPIEQVGDLVMIYPKEGSVLNANPAGIVDAPWVTPDHVEGASEWIDFLRERRQQEKFMARGFRPATGTGVDPDPAQFRAWGLDVTQPSSTISPGELDPDVLDRIIESWGSVKNPAVVTFVVDVSGSMTGPPIEQVRSGMFNLLDALADSNNPGNDSQVGLVTFASEIVEEVSPVSIGDSKFEIADVVRSMQANGGTALYDAVARAIELTDQATADEAATRAVVILSDGAATEGRLCLTDIVEVSSTREVPIESFCGHEGDQAVDVEGNRIDGADLTGIDLAWEHENDPIQIFFVGFGSSDVNIGRVLAQATGAEFQGSTDDDLAAVIEDLSGYF